VPRAPDAARDRGRLGHDEPLSGAHLRELLARAGADPDLDEAPLADGGEAAPHGAGVVVALPEVALAQVPVGIELHQQELGVARVDRLDRAGRHRVLAAQHERHQAGLQQGAHGLAHAFDHRLGGAHRDLEVAEIAVADVAEVPILIGRVALEHDRHRAQVVGSEARAGAEGGRAVERHAEDRDVAGHRLAP
jgi:hypothetical protein